MKKIKSEKNDWLHPEYKREELGPIVRGKYARRIAAESNVVVIDPDVAKAFPNEESVNAALRGLVNLAKVSTRSAAKSAGLRTKSERIRG